MGGGGDVKWGVMENIGLSTRLEGVGGLLVFLTILIYTHTHIHHQHPNTHLHGKTQLCRRNCVAVKNAN